MSVHFMSEKMDWETPKELYDELDREFGFIYDAACTSENCLAP